MELSRMPGGLNVALVNMGLVPQPGRAGKWNGWHTSICAGMCAGPDLAVFEDFTMQEVPVPQRSANRSGPVLRAGFGCWAGLEGGAL